MLAIEGSPAPQRQPNEGGVMPRIFSIRPTWSLKGRRFQGVRGFTGKPFHPPLTDFPIVCFTLAALFDLISFFSKGDPFRARDFFVAATFVMVAGYVVAILAIITGFWDWWKGIPRDRKSGPIGKAKHTQVWRTINWHATVMITAEILTFFNLIQRIPNFEEGQTLAVWLVLSVISAGLVLFGAAYGGTLVFEYGFNVENVEEVWKESEEDHVRLPRGGSSS
jgi:uncharacterized membrane protein